MSLASPWRGIPEFLYISTSATLIFINETLGFCHADFEAVIKSLYLVPTPITRSEFEAISLAPFVPVAPIAPKLSSCL